MAAGGPSSGQPQFLARAGDESFSHAPLIENSETDQIVVPDVRINFYFSDYQSFHVCNLLDD